MLSFSEILSFLKLNFAIIFSLFFPGWLVLRYFFIQKNFAWLEKTVLSLGLSLFLIDFFFIFLDHWNISFTKSAILFLCLNLLATIPLIFQKKKTDLSLKEKNDRNNNPLFWLILILIVVFRVFYLFDKVIPSSTDLGHHMYWSKSIIQTNHLPDYGMPDFIIGEHIIFALISFFSEWDLVSALPMSILFLINVFSLLAFFLLAQETFSSLEISSNPHKKKNSHPIALLVFLLGGAFYSFSSPQTSFVSGGVVGNLLGNLFIPLILWLLILANKNKDKKAGILAVLICATLAYTHHLSSYIFLFTFLFFFAFLLFNDLIQFLTEKKYLFFSKDFLLTFLNKSTIFSFLLFFFFVIFIQPPSYLNKAAIDTAVGEPSKNTRTGYGWNELFSAIGDWRFFWSLVGFILLVFLVINKLFPKKNLLWIKEKLHFNKELNANSDLFSYWLIMAWSLSIFLLSYVPQWLKTNIPSRRIVSYLTWPASILAGIGLFFIFILAQKKLEKKAVFWIIFIFLVAGVFSSNQESKPYILSNQDNSEAYSTFSASQYLAEKSPPKSQILKDHIYLKGDTWVKIFLMRSYNEPLSRSNLSRYNDPTKPRETCTRDIIAAPDSAQGKQCLKETGVQYVLLGKNKDDQNFKKSSDWSKIFSNSNTSIFFSDYASKN